MRLTAYPVRDKAKSMEICRAFVAGCRGEVVEQSDALRDGAAFFYGIDAGNEHVWRQVRRERRTYFYCDNAYFDQTRGTHFRVTRNGVQHSGDGVSNGHRFRALNIPIQLWRAHGAPDDPIVVCPQSEHFMRTVAAVEFDWLHSTQLALARFSTRPLAIRPWSPHKGKLASTLAADLEHAHALVTWSSAAAVTAVLAGVPIVTMGPCAAAPMSGDLARVEYLPRPERDNWAGVLADNQFTLRELADGTAWRALQR